MSLYRMIRGRTGTTPRLLVAFIALVATGAIYGVGPSMSSAATKHKTVTVTFWNAYNDVTETPVMNGIVIPAFEAAEPRDQGGRRHAALQRHAPEVHRRVGRGSSTET